MGRYEILSGPDLYVLQQSVTEYIEAGWVPAGGPFYCDLEWRQAVYWTNQ